MRNSKQLAQGIAIFQIITLIMELTSPSASRAQTADFETNSSVSIPVVPVISDETPSSNEGVSVPIEIGTPAIDPAPNEPGAGGEPGPGGGEPGPGNPGGGGGPGGGGPGPNPSPAPKPAPPQTDDLVNPPASPPPSGFLPTAPSSFIESVPTPQAKYLRPEVDQSTGALSFSIPIATPPGRNSVSPNISLRYNSQNTAEDTILGFGWDVSIPSISRGSHRGGISYDASFNNFVSSMSGDLTRLTATSTRFAPRVEDGSFSQYEFQDNGQQSSWYVATKDGFFYEFGLTADARQDDPQNASHVARWMLERIEDKNGNSVVFSYFKHQGQIYPNAITYTNSVNAPGIYRVEFDRESRSQIIPSYQNKFLVQSTYRISAIRILANGQAIHSYALAYQEQSRNMLVSITETGYAEDGTPTTLPATVFSYSQTAGGIPSSGSLVSGISIDFYRGVVVADVNGDEYADIIKSACVLNGSGGCNTVRAVYLNTYNNSFVDATSIWNPPALFCFDNSSGICLPDQTSLYDANGDQLNDFVTNNGYYKNTGNGWETTLTSGGPGVPAPNYNTIANLLGDTDGDGLPQIFNPIGTQSGNASVVGVRTADINRDGLTDYLLDYPQCNNTQAQTEEVYLSTGNGFVQSTQMYSHYFPTPTIFTQQCSFGFNGNAPNALSLIAFTPTSYPEITDVLGNANQSPNPTIQVGDFNGDGLLDKVGNSGAPLNQTALFINTGTIPALLTAITRPSGATTEVAYKSSAQYTDASNQLLNPRLSFPVITVERITDTETVGALVNTSLYEYAGGSYYFAGSFDRKFAGFEKVTEARPDGSKRISYFHQGNATNTALNESDDHFSKIGKAYREEVVDAQGNILTQTVSKIEKSPLPSFSGDRFFVRADQTVSRDFSVAGPHRDRATTYTYDADNGNLQQKNNWGEVTASDPLVFTDIAGDRVTNSYGYTNSSTTTTPYSPGASLPSTITRTIYANNSGTFNGAGSQSWYSAATALANGIATVSNNDSMQAGEFAQNTGTGQPTLGYFYMTRGFMVFDTSAIPSNAVVTNATITLSRTQGSASAVTNPTINHGMYVTSGAGLANGVQTIGNALGCGSAQANPLAFGALTPSSVHNLTIAPTGIILGGYTKFCIRDGFDYNGVPYPYPTAVGTWASFRTFFEGMNASDPALRPKLVIAYYIPSPTGPTAISSTEIRTYRSLPTLARTMDEAGNFSALEQYFYDDMPYSEVGAGNLTRIETRVDANTTAVTESTYNTLGLKTSDTDPNGNTTQYAYDSANLFPATIVNALGQSKSFLYNYALGKPKQVTDENGVMSQIKFDGLGRTIEEKGPEPQTGALVAKATYTYNDIPQNLSVTKNTNFDSTQIITEKTYLDSLGRTIQTRRQTEQNFISGAMTDAVVADVRYDNTGRVSQNSLPYFSLGLSKTAATGNPNLWINYQYDVLDRVTQKSDAVGQSTVSMNIWDNTVTDPDGKIKTYSTDAYSRLADVVERNNNQSLTTSYQYDSLGNLTKLTDALDNVRNFAYDYLGRRISAEDLHNPTDTGNTFGVRTSFYDLAGNLTQITDSRGTTTVYQYDALNRVTQEDDISVPRVERYYHYDNCNGGIGKLCSITSADGFSNFEYDFVGNITREAKFIGENLSETETRYNRSGAVIFQKAPDNTESTYSYNAGGSLEQTFEKKPSDPVPIAKVTNYDYAPTGAVAYKTESSGVTQSFIYNPSQVYRIAEKRAGMSQTTGAATTTTANSSSIDLERDGTQYLSAQNYPLFSITGDMTFESWINLESLPTPTPNGYKTIAGKYSNPGNQSGVQTSWLLYYVNNGVFGPRMSFYMMGNANGSSYIGLQWNLALATSTWHQVALVVTPAVPGIASKAKLYIDGVDQGAPVYTEGGGVTAIAFSTAPFAIGAHTYGQDSFDGKMDDVRLWNVARTAQEIQANYTHELSSTEPNLAAYWKFNNTYYDSTTNNNILTPINAPVFETDVPFGGGLIPASTFTSITATTTYAYSPAGDIVAINETNATPQLANSLTQKLYAYDDLHRLIHSETVSQNSPSTRYDYAYNAIGNMTAQGRNGATTTYLYEGNLGNSFANPNAATKMIPPSGPQLVLSYDQNGNLLSDPITGTTNVWNYRNELVSTTKGATTTQYTYDAGGIRDTINDGSTLQTFPSPSYSETVDLLSGERTIEKHISGITFETKYANATSSPTNREFSTIADHLGSTEKVMDSNHAVVEDVTYDPFGKIISDVSTSDFSEKRKYTSHELDAETGYTYAKARYLNTETARFISEDPAFWNISDALLADPQQQNSYSYARNNPIKYVDPDGEKVELVSRPINGTSAELGPGVLGAHAYILVTPEIHIPYARPSYTLQELNSEKMDTTRPFTLGAYTHNGSNLYKAVNGDVATTQCNDCANVTVAPPKGVDQVTFEENLVNYYNSLPAELSSTYNPLGNGLSDSPNSNNAATSILVGAGISRAKIDHYYQNMLLVQNWKFVPGLGESLNEVTARMQIKASIQLIDMGIRRLGASINISK